MAGYSEDKNEGVVENSATVQEEIARIKAEVASNVKITKEEVVEMFMVAAGMAKVIGDVQGLVAAAREVGKMLGYYAPEVKKTLVGLDKATIKQVIEQMDDEELARYANAKVIDGQSKRIEHKNVPGVQGNEGPEVVLQEG